MAGQIYIVHYGTRNPRLTPINNAEYAAKVAAGLKRIAAMLEDPATEFLTAREFAAGQANNTWLHVSMVTEPETIPPDPGDITDPTTVDLQPRSQFNCHVMIKHVTDEDELADGLTSISPGGRELDSG